MRNARITWLTACLVVVAGASSILGGQLAGAPGPVTTRPGELSRYVLSFTGALPGQAELIVHLGEQDGIFRQAWAQTSGVWMLAKDVDASQLRLKGRRLTGTLKVNTARVPDTANPPGGSPGVMGAYELDVRLDGDRLEGTFEGTWAWRIGREVVTPEGKLGLEADDLKFATRPPRPVDGTVAVRVRSQEELRRQYSVAEGRDWPNYHGPRGAYAATPGGHELVDSFADARLLWKSEFTPPGRLQTRRYGEGNLHRFLERGATGGGASPVVKDGRVYLYYFEPAGEEMDGYWRQSIDAGRRVVRKQWHARADDVFLCVDAATGQTLWKQRFPLAGRNDIGAKGSFTHTMAVGDGVAIGRGSGGITYAFDAKTGELLWRQSIGGGHASIIIDGVLFHARSGGVLDVPLIAFNARSGEQLWEIPGAVGRMALPLHWTHDGKHYVIAGTTEGTVRCVEVHSGEVLWEERGVGYNLFSPQNDGDYLVANTAATGRDPGAPGGFRITPEGLKKMWSVPKEKVNQFGGARTPPVIADGIAWIPNYRDAGLAVDFETGEVSTFAYRQQNSFFYVMDDKLILDMDVTHERTEIGIAPLDPSRVDTAEAKVSTPHRTTSAYWPHPFRHALFDGRIIIRGAHGMYCYDLRKPKAAQRIEEALDAREGQPSGVVDALAAFMRDDDAQVRDMAARELARRAAEGEWGDRGEVILGHMKALLAHEEESVREDALDAVSRLGQDAVELLGEMVASPETRRRIVAMQAAGRLAALELPDDGIDQVIAHGLDDSDRSMILTALDAAAARGGKAGMLAPRLMELAASDDARIKNNAIRALLMYHPPDAFPFGDIPDAEAHVIGFLGAHPYSDKVGRAVNVIIAQGDDEALRIFSGLLEGDNALKGVRACHGLASMGDAARPAIPLIEAARARWSARAFRDASANALRQLRNDDE
ncbi:MAG: PQQ-binding-like beta-propeller repeat protein [Phycisphaeraceae bacterium]|nr:PQQ-binding-like beta-propeller repeat protein [Phycisphaeraceae bacterium]